MSDITPEVTPNHWLHYYLCVDGKVELASMQLRHIHAMTPAELLEFLRETMNAARASGYNEGYADATPEENKNCECGNCFACLIGGCEACYYDACPTHTR